MKTQHRKSLSEKERRLVRWKTNGHCHICGGHLGSEWTADNVVPHGLGGKGSVDNYLPACGACNRLRWFYNAQEIKMILRLGVYAYAEMRNGTSLGKDLKKLYANRIKQNKIRSGKRSKTSVGAR